MTTIRMPKAPKYRNKKLTIDGVTWHSKAEYGRWCLLWKRQQVGQIQGLRRQVAFKLVVNGLQVSRYTADFVYYECGSLVVEDSKSPITRELNDYVIRRKLMKAIYGIEIREV
jgi:hypothetical protein